MTPRFQDILIPVDFTKKNRAAVDVAFEIAVENHARMTLLHVVERIEGLDDDPEVQDLYRRLQSGAESEMDALAARFAGTSVLVEQKVRFGNRAREIVQHCLDRGIDLVVMSSHPVDLAEPMRGWATVSYQVSILCPCSILLVKQPPERSNGP